MAALIATGAPGTIIEGLHTESSMTTLFELNTSSVEAFTATLAGIYEHSPWIPGRAAALRPFATTAALKLALQGQVVAATEDEQLGLIRAHPELAGKAAIAGTLTQESTHEQAKSGSVAKGFGGEAEIKGPQAELEAAIAKHATDNKLTRPEATAAVLATPVGKRLYAAANA